MFIGIDHGTTAIRFATNDGAIFELGREDAARPNILKEIERGLNMDLADVELIALTYSMGDGISRIMDINDVEERGIRCIKGAGKYVGGGTNLFDAISRADLPAIVIPGIHTGIDIDPRMRVFSHGASPDKIGAAYHIYKKSDRENFIMSDISSNTVTLGVANRRIVGAIDACIFAPGLYHGPLDLNAIREVDEGIMTANEAFSKGGVIKMTSFPSLSEMMKAHNEEMKLALTTLALFASMEISAMNVLIRDHSPKVNRQTAVFLVGSLGEMIKDEIDNLLDMKTIAFGRWASAKGCAEIARDVFDGKGNILGVNVSERIKHDRD
jgi:putative methanogenesis marker protein 12